MLRRLGRARLPALRPFLGPVLAYAALGVGLWAVPLVGTLHVEGAAVVAAAACLVSAGWGAGQLRAGRDAAAVLAAAAVLSLLPVALLGLSAAWRPNCGWAQGLGLALQFVPAAAAFGVGLSALTVGLGVRRAGTLAVLLAVGVGLAGAAFDLGLHPQVYTYSHVFGGVLGPIYDERLAVRPGLLAFRGLTLLWTGALVWGGSWVAVRRRGERLDPLSRGAGVVMGLLLALGYASAPDLGITTPERALQRELSRHVARPSLDLYTDPATTTLEQAERLADLAAYRLREVERRLGAEVSDRVQLYVYADADQKARLVGARETSVAPVWLRTPQVHLLSSRVAGSLAHEMAHAVSREFGLPVLNATLAVGLVEGLAVAAEPPDGLPHPHDLVAAAARYRDSTQTDTSGIGQRYADGLAASVGASMSPLGFWGGRAAVSYTTAGSFTAFLLDRYGPDPLRAAYATADFEGAYGQPVQRLADEWAAFIGTREPSAVAAAVVERQFSRPSLFEQRCPHHEPRARRLLRAAYRADETDEAKRLARTAWEADTTSSAAFGYWAQLHLAFPEQYPDAIARFWADALHERTSTDSTSALLHSRMGDALALGERPAPSRAAYARALDLQPPQALADRLVVRAKHMLADQPALVRAWLQQTPEAAALLGEATGPGAMALGSLRLAALDEPEQASRLAAEASAVWPDAAEAVQLLLCAARWAEAAGQIAPSTRLLQRAARLSDEAERPELAAFARSEARRLRTMGR